MLRNGPIGGTIAGLDETSPRWTIRGEPLERHLLSGPAKLRESLNLGKDLELDLQLYQLRRAGRVLKLERIPLEILVFLVEQRGGIVTREQIVERIWGKGVFLDTDNSINIAVRKIRRVLRDDPDEPRFIQTITGQGYRFLGPVVEMGTLLQENQSAGSLPTREATGESKSFACGSGSPAPSEQVSTTLGSAGALRRESRPWAIYAAICLAIVTTLFMWSLRFRSQPAQANPGKVMLAVLPFQNLTGDTDQEYFSDGLTDEMITKLGNLEPQQLGVIARTSVMHYKDGHVGLDQVARELGVQYVLEGSVRRDSDRVRITAQLIQTKDQTHLWAREYDRELSGLLGIQSEIAREVADEIQLTFDHATPAKLPEAPALSPDAYQSHDLYLRGQYFLNKRTRSGFEKAIVYFQKATEQDSTNARAYAGIADCYALMGGYSGLQQTEFISRARAAALKALELDETLPEAHTALGLIVENYDWDWQTAAKEFRRAIQLNSNYATAHQWYAEYLMWRGQFRQALQESERARQLAPLSLIIASDNAAILYLLASMIRALRNSALCWIWIRTSHMLT